MVIHELSRKFPNSGSVNKALDKFYSRIEKLSKTEQSIPVLVSILVDIAFNNPRTYPIASAILSKFLSLIDDDVTKNRILDSIDKRFSKIPNTGHIQIWLQRVVLKTNRPKIFKETLCRKVNNPVVSVWNSDWLKGNLKTAIETEMIVIEETIDEIDEVIDPDEVRLFDTKSGYR